MQKNNKAIHAESCVFVMIDVQASEFTYNYAECTNNYVLLSTFLDL